MIYFHGCKAFQLATIAPTSLSAVQKHLGVFSDYVKKLFTSLGFNYYGLSRQSRQQWKTQYQWL